MKNTETCLIIGVAILVLLFGPQLFKSAKDEVDSLFEDDDSKEGFHNYWSWCSPWDWRCRSFYKTYRWRRPYFSYRPWWWY